MKPSHLLIGRKFGFYGKTAGERETNIKMIKSLIPSKRTENQTQDHLIINSYLGC